jgi:transglutaminase-like putative cysteine protease
MNRKLRELETITLAMFAAVPLYATYAVSPLSVFLFHLTMTVLGIRVAMRGMDFDRYRTVIQIAGAAYLLVFPIDAIFLSHSLIRASGHLIFFIIIYQTLESSWRNNERQRFLTTFLLFVTSVATATHISIVLYVAGFTLLCYRQLIFLTHLRTCQDLNLEPSSLRVSRPAMFYVIPTTLIASMLFPILPRVRNPFVSGFAGDLGRATSGISDTINFSEARTISPDPEVVARVWMARDAVPFFTPLRLRVRNYERYDGREWRSSRYLRLKWIDSADGRFGIARPQGFSRKMTIQQRTSRDQRSSLTKLFLPVGTHSIHGFNSIMGSSVAGLFMAPAEPGGSVTYDVLVSRQELPLTPEAPSRIQYPVRPEVQQFARQIIGNATLPTDIAAKIETHLSTRFSYLANPAELGRPISVDQFLLREKRGHCEYFAAGMVVLLTSLNVPARIVGGYYGGDYNPLAGYFVIRQRDAHAWVEVWDGVKWRTYDPTPAALRPGSSSSGLIRAYWNAISDSVNYFWDRYILTYSLNDQVALFQEGLTRGQSLAQRVRTKVSSLAKASLNPYILAGVISLGAAIFLVPRLKRRRSLFDRLQARLSNLGFDVSASMTAYEVLDLIRTRRPDLGPEVSQIVDTYVLERFSARPVPPESHLAAIYAISRLR